MVVVIYITKAISTKPQHGISELFDTAGIGIRVKAGTLSLIGWTPSWEMTWPKKSNRAAPIRVLSGESFMS